MKLFTPKGRDHISICNVCQREIRKMGLGSHAQMHIRKGEAIERFNFPFSSEYLVAERSDDQKA